MRSRTAAAAAVGVLALLASAFAPAPTAPWSQVDAIPLSAPEPDWYTPALHDRVLAAAELGEGVPLPDGVELPASALAFTGIRPGSWILSPAGCTTNFVFGSASNLFIGTAGHCTSVGDEVTIVAAPGVLMNIGTTVRSVDGGIGNDFALIDVRPEMEPYVNPSTAYFGGPTAAGDPRVGDLVTHAGHGLVVGTGGTPRAGAVVYRGAGEGGSSDAFAWAGVATPGDSGSFVLEADGTAAGVLTHIVVGGAYLPGTTAGTSIARMTALAGRPLVTTHFGPDPLY